MNCLYCRYPLTVDQNEIIIEFQDGVSIRRIYPRWRHLYIMTCQHARPEEGVLAINEVEEVV